ncbi:MAG: hypothetical protein ACP5QI_04735 [Candidatus Bathyarchaeia archaeon]
MCTRKREPSGFRNTSIPAQYILIPEKAFEALSIMFGTGWRRLEGRGGSLRSEFDLFLGMLAALIGWTWTARLAGCKFLWYAGALAACILPPERNQLGKLLLMRLRNRIEWRVG